MWHQNRPLLHCPCWSRQLCDHVTACKSAKSCRSPIPDTMWTNCRQQSLDNSQCYWEHRLQKWQIWYKITTTRGERHKKWKSGIYAVSVNIGTTIAQEVELVAQWLKGWWFTSRSIPSQPPKGICTWHFGGLSTLTFIHISSVLRGIIVDAGQ